MFSFVKFPGWVETSRMEGLSFLFVSGPLGLLGCQRLILKPLSLFVINLASVV